MKFPVPRPRISFGQPGRNARRRLKNGRRQTQRNDRYTRFTSLWRTWQPKRKQVEKIGAKKVAIYHQTLRDKPAKRIRLNRERKIARDVIIKERIRGNKTNKFVRPEFV